MTRMISEKLLTIGSSFTLSLAVKVPCSRSAGSGECKLPARIGLGDRIEVLPAQIATELNTMTWITANLPVVRKCAVACGVVCGSAGVRDAGGLVYARQLARRIGRPNVFQLALSGEIPPRSRLRSWEWRAPQVFALIMRKPQLFLIRPDSAKANEVGWRIGSISL